MKSVEQLLIVFCVWIAAVALRTAIKSVMGNKKGGR